MDNKPSLQEMESKPPDEKRAGATLSSRLEPIEANIKALKLIVLTTIVCVCICAGLVYKLFLTPEWLVKHMGLTDEIVTELARKVDSGYSTTVIFQNGKSSGDAFLSFYCLPDQSVGISLHATPVDFPQDFTPSLQLQLDGFDLKNLGEGPNHLPNTSEIRRIDSFFSVDDAIAFRSRTLHQMRIIAKGTNRYPPKGYLVVDVLLLVSNGKI